MAFTTNLTGTAQVDSSLVLAFDQAFILANAQNNVMDQFVSYKANIGAVSISFPKYGQLPLATTPLTETSEVVSTAMSDQAIILTPKEYGQAITSTNLASLQSGGKIDLAAAQLVGTSMGRTKDMLAIQALDAGATNVLDTAADANGALLNKFYAKLSSGNVATVGGDTYVMVAHANVIADIQMDPTWIDVAKYATPEMVLRNEVGMFKGFRVVRDNHAAAVAGSYPVYFMGANALGLAVSQEAAMVATGPFDTLGRTINIGWYGVFGYGVVDTDAIWVGKFTSSQD